VHHGLHAGVEADYYCDCPPTHSGGLCQNEVGVGDSGEGAVKVGIFVGVSIGVALLVGVLVVVMMRRWLVRIKSAKEIESAADAKDTDEIEEDLPSVT